jgi:alanine racemase
VNRRAFLATPLIPLLPQLAAASQAQRAASASPFDPWLEINAQHLKQNASEVARLTGRPVLAVIKNNGYGLGVVNAATVLETHAPVYGFAVVKLQEALDLRAAGIGKPILLMAPIDETVDMPAVIDANVMPMVYTPIGDALEKQSQRVGRVIPIHVCVDTGIGRVGAPYREADTLIRDLGSRRGVTINGTMMTYTEDLAFDKEQTQRFNDLATSLKSAGLTLGRLHAASTYTLFQHGPETFFDMSRVGMALLGLYPDPKFKAMKIVDLEPALAFRVRKAARRRHQCGIRARVHCEEGHVDRDVAGGPRRRLAARRRERRARAHQRKDVPGDRIRVCESHPGGDRRPAGGEGGRRRDVIRLARRLAP